MYWLWLCDTTEFLTRSHCGTGWVPWLRQAYQLANFLTWFSYLVIALALGKLYRSKKSELPAPGLFVLATAFLLLCGLSHLGNVVVFTWAPYRLFTVIDVLTAAVSVVVACRIPSVVDRMVGLPAQEFVHEVNQALADELALAARTKQEQSFRIEALKEQVRSLGQMIKIDEMITKKNAVMEEFANQFTDGELKSWKI